MFSNTIYFLPIGIILTFLPDSSIFLIKGPEVDVKSMYQNPPDSKIHISPFHISERLPTLDDFRKTILSFSCSTPFLVLLILT